MSRRCSICNLPESIRADVDTMLAARTVSLSEIAEQFAPRRHGAPKISRSALDRHRRKCLARQEALAELAPQAEVVPAEGNRLLAITESVQTRVEQLLASAGGFLEGSEMLADPKSGLAAIREARKCLEVIGRITGELHANAAVAVQINNAHAQPTADFSKFTIEEMVTLKRLIEKAKGNA